MQCSKKKVIEQLKQNNTFELWKITFTTMLFNAGLDGHHLKVDRSRKNMTDMWNFDYLSILTSKTQQLAELQFAFRKILMVHLHENIW